MKFIVLLAIAAFFAVTPLYLYDTLVQPELNTLSNNYSNFDQTAQDIAASKSSDTAKAID